MLGNMKKVLFVAILAVLGVVLLTAGLTSCNVTRVVTTESSCYQRGDTSVAIIVKTVETYDASKKGL